MSANKLERTTFSASRAAEYFDARQLSTLTGVPTEEFANVVLKELVDNSLDACETAGVPPEITVTVGDGGTGGVIRVRVSDNGPGIPSEVVRRLLDYEVGARQRQSGVPLADAGGPGQRPEDGYRYPLRFGLARAVNCGGSRRHQARHRAKHRPGRERAHRSRGEQRRTLGRRNERGGARRAGILGGAGFGAPRARLSPSTLGALVRGLQPPRDLPLPR